MTEKQLLELRSQLNDAKSELSELKGKRKHLLEELNKKYGCETVKQAMEKLKKLKAQYDKRMVEIEKGTDELEEKYEL